MIINIGLWLWRALMIIIWLIVSYAIWGASQYKPFTVILQALVTIWFALWLLVPNIIGAIWQAITH